MHRTVHVVDLPGHGRSRGSAVPLRLDACVEEVAAAVPVAPWCGWSLGGLVALQAAASPADAGPGAGDAVRQPAFRARHARRLAPRRVAGDLPRLRGRTARRLPRHPRALHRAGGLRVGPCAPGDPRLRDELFARGEPDAAVLADGLELLETTDLRNALPTLGVPSLWLAGRRDRLVDPRAMREASALAPGSSFHVVEHAGHAPFLTHADEVAAHLQAFLDPAVAGAATLDVIDAQVAADANPTAARAQ
jgi:pimeloyl-[acyl-carrier protein] methyl ester esterase